MSDSLTDSPYLGRRYCPACEPDTDPSREIVEALWCVLHPQTDRGPDDARVVPSGQSLYGGQEAEGESNRLWCDLVHRGAR